MNMSTLYLSLQSMRNRLLSTSLTMLAIAISVSLLLGVERVRDGARDSFEQTIADTDLIVGARSGPVQLLLYSVFHIGHASNHVTWQSYQEWAHHPEVAWSVPISLGDSHRGYRVIGTTNDYFVHYKVGRKKALTFSQGERFSDLYDAVVGADVATRLGYELGQKITLAHGVSDVSFQDHADKPFTVVGILAKTGTPVDRAVHISLAGLEAMHIDWQDGAPPLGDQLVSADEARQQDLTPQDITAMMLGLRAKMGIFHVQRAINDYEPEALTAIMPGVTFRELWETVGIAETALLVIACLVVIAGLLGMVAAILTTLGERRRELAILRALGARPRDIFLLLLGEAFFLALGGCVLGLLVVYGGLYLAGPWIEQYFGLAIPVNMLSGFDCALLAAVFTAALLAGCLPALKAYRHSLADGLAVRV